MKQKPVDTSFDGKWEVIDGGPGHTPKACLGEDDVMKMKALLDMCAVRAK